MEMAKRFLYRNSGIKRNSKSYSAWRSMWQRITDRNCKKYDRYGGRGINICDRWKKFENFQMDMGEKPDGMSLDRINNDGDYCPENCRWATSRMQTRNYARNVKVTFRGRTQCLADWAEELQMPYQRLWERIRIYNWPIKDAFFQPKTIHHARRPKGHVSIKIVHS